LPGEPPALRVDPSDESDLRAAIAEVERGETVELTPDELKHWAETGEWPERLG
jgi:hypothetical protein